MSEYNIRVANQGDAEEIQRLMYEAFTPLRELGIDWPSVNADVDLVEQNIKTSTTFVLKMIKKLYLPLRYVIHGKENDAFLYIHLSGGLRQSRVMMAVV